MTSFLAKVYKHVNCCIRCYTNKKLFGIKKKLGKGLAQTSKKLVSQAQFKRKLNILIMFTESEYKTKFQNDFL